MQPRSYLLFMNYVYSSTRDPQGQLTRLIRILVRGAAHVIDGMIKFRKLTQRFCTLHLKLQELLKNWAPEPQQYSNKLI